MKRLLSYKDFIFESAIDNIKKNTQFLDDLNICVNEMLNENNFYAFWNLQKKYPDILKKEEFDKSGDYQADLHNKNKIPKRITFVQSLKFWLNGIRDINKNICKIEPNFTDWFFNQEIELYRGFPVSQTYKNGNWIHADETRESLIESETKYKSFTMKFGTAINFTQESWLSRGWIDIKERNGWIIKTKIKPCDVHMFSNEGNEYECILKQPIKYTGYFRIENAETIKDVNY